MIQPDSTIIRPIANENELELVHRLTHDAYVAMGYATPQPSGKLVHYGDFDHLPETTVLVVERGNEIIGTGSLTLDGPWGLTVEKDFKRVCDHLRYSGRSIAVAWRLVIAKSAGASNRIILDLLREFVNLTASQGVNTTLITVNPRHQSAYQRLLNATVLAKENMTKGLDQAPGVLLRLDYERVAPSWKKTPPIGRLSQRAA
jgi:hypothetical protein